MRLVKAMSPCNQFYRDPLKAAPVWKKNELLEVIHRLACADGGYLQVYN